MNASANSSAVGTPVESVGVIMPQRPSSSMSLLLNSCSSPSGLTTMSSSMLMNLAYPILSAMTVAAKIFL
eukprot:CAMPEP_0197573284 /NCGR_PEP_ID=MMETSP1320-20131121/42890_1 /TAXON_ID=91990 /ORGANISM="Bolidomonas sp., Strain RCC2347" /LENGTH=69 /DNA_ID=CAMNT_0043135799 /DNA_START=692 /DNA_END=901 /DNA_ORIENTATION=-